MKLLDKVKELLFQSMFTPAETVCTATFFLFIGMMISGNGGFIGAFVTLFFWVLAMLKGSNKKTSKEVVF